MTSSQFNNDFLGGLNVISKGAITLSSLTADGNGNAGSGLGANLDNSGGTGAIAISSSQFNTNQLDGLDILSKGAITLSSLTATGNTVGVGVNLNNPTSLGTVTITSSTFNSNHGD